MSTRHLNLCCGQRFLCASASREVEALRGLVKEFYVIGDANKAAKIMNATRDAYDAVTTLGFM